MPTSATSTASQHCCACQVVCHHTGGPYLCPTHQAGAVPAAQTGWICPACQCVWAPHVDSCRTCAARSAAPSSPTLRLRSE